MFKIVKKHNLKLAMNKAFEIVTHVYLVIKIV